MAKLFLLNRSDEAILKAIGQRDEKALDYLYKSNLRMITRLVTQNNGSYEDAVELLQDVLVIFYEKVHSKNFTLTSKISTYLYAVAKNKWLQELHRRSKYTVIENIHNNPGSDKQYIDHIQEEEMIHIVKKCLDNLKPICKKILIMYYYHEKSMREIKEVTGLANECVAKSKKYQCKKELEYMVKSMLKDRI